LRFDSQQQAGYIAKLPKKTKQRRKKTG